LDSFRFDTLTRTFSASGIRRGLLRLLMALPVAGVLAGRLDERVVAADRDR